MESVGHWREEECQGKVNIDSVVSTDRPPASHVDFPEPTSPHKTRTLRFSTAAGLDEAAGSFGFVSTEVAIEGLSPSSISAN